MDDLRCGSCRYFDPFDEPVGRGDCRLRPLPPALRVVAFAMARATDYGCRRFRAARRRKRSKPPIHERRLRNDQD